MHRNQESWCPYFQAFHMHESDSPLMTMSWLPKTLYQVCKSSQLSISTKLLLLYLTSGDMACKIKMTRSTTALLYIFLLHWYLGTPWISIGDIIAVWENQAGKQSNGYHVFAHQVLKVGRERCLVDVRPAQVEKYSIQNWFLLNLDNMQSAAAWVMSRTSVWEATLCSQHDVQDCFDKCTISRSRRSTHPW